MKKFYYILLFVFLTFSEGNVIAQELSGGADIMSRYIWRGRDFGNSLSIQPTLEYSYSNFTIGTWGAFSINADVFQEHDIYLSYSFMDMFSVGVTDYFFPAFPVDNIAYNNKYFDYGEETTGHYLEANFGFDGTKSFPISISANVFFYGADVELLEMPNPDDPENPIVTRGDKIYSTYIELGYSNALGEIDYDIFAGFTPNSGESLYSDDAGLVNLGITVKKEVKISESFSLPVQTSFITNPAQENIYFVFGFTL